MNESQRAKAVLTDSHFLIPVLVFCFGLAVLIALQRRSRVRRRKGKFHLNRQLLLSPVKVRKKKKVMTSRRKTSGTMKRATLK